MSHSERRNWLVAYDIADPRRLQRVHAYLKRHAIPVQYSVFVLRDDARALNTVLRGIAERIDENEDDVRAYHLPARCEVTALGRQYLPEGILLPVEGLDRLLHELTPTHGATIVPKEEVTDDG